MPPGQDDNPFGTPRGAWGRQPPTTFGISTPVKRAPRPTNQIRVPTPSLAPRNILTGGLVSQPRPAAVAPPPAPPPVIAPEPSPATAPEIAAEPHDRPLATGSVLARASAAPKARAGGLPFPPVAGIGLVIAAIVVVGMLLLGRDPPAPEPAAAAAPVAPVQPPQAAVAEPEVAPSPVATATAATSARAVRPSTTRPTRRVAPEAEPSAAPITPPPLVAPPIVLAPAPPAPAPAVPPPTDPEVPMTTRLPQ
ncbi:hypothetical protein [Phenylobacterium sp.]|uniref:hypothetical protein n=1 Tax=Phenylobacterium sp. TaxID=1871053 RepID=UPI00286E81B4|nr:hypothetical protein [Phenylobacterium sp.]